MIRDRMSSLVFGNQLSNYKTDRASAVPYTMKNGKLYFLLGVDRDSGDITDMGGGVKGDETALLGLKRELWEESSSLFDGYYGVNDMLDCISILDLKKRMATLFLPIDSSWLRNATIHFDKNPSDEIRELVWVTENQFINLFSSRKSKMWNRLKHYYNQHYTDVLSEDLKLLFRIKIDN